MFGLIQLPKWLKNLWLAGILVVTASAISHFLPAIPKDTLAHNLSWFLIHPMWGLGFFMLVNRAVTAEREWLQKLSMPWVVAAFATLGVFSYSIYLTHELVIMQSWRFVEYWLPPFINTFLVVIPATILFAWVFFWFCERPYMRKRAEVQKEDARTHKEEPPKDRPQEITPITQLEPESA
jgi:peptidoglycan/LPS O-acetylase OafA/YrhL